MSASETIAAFCREHGVPFDCLRGRERFRDVVRLRHALIVRLRVQGFRVTRIARLLDKNHATVIRALRMAGVR